VPVVVNYVTFLKLIDLLIKVTPRIFSYRRIAKILENAVSNFLCILVEAG